MVVKMKRLESFLSSLKCQNLYLVGDIIDFWSMADNFYWPNEHENILNIFEAKHKEGTNVLYISGNHDDPLRDKNLIEKLKSKMKRLKK